MKPHDRVDVVCLTREEPFTIILTTTHERIALSNIIKCINRCANVRLQQAHQEASQVTLQLNANTYSLFCVLHRMESLPYVQHISFGLTTHNP